VFLLGENGVHERLAPPGTTVNVLATADLSGDQNDEIYYRLGASITVLGSQFYSNFATRSVVDLTSSGAWTYSSGSVPVAATAFLPQQGGASQLAIAYPGDDNIYGTAIVGGKPVRGAPLYTGSTSTPLFPSGSAVQLMRGADIATAGESGLSGEELYAAFDNAAIVGVYLDVATNAWQRANVYSGSQMLSIMAPGKLRSGESKQRMYQRFAGPYVYETVPASGSNLPGFGTASLFYTGSTYCDMLVAGDFDGDGLDEMANHYTGVPTRIYWGEEVSGTVYANVGYLYNGSATPTMLQRMIDANNADRLLTIFSGTRVVYLSQGMADNGYDYTDWIRQRAWASEGL
jgi:hypothetical protein